VINEEHLWNETGELHLESDISQHGRGFEHLDCEWCIYCRTTSTGTMIFAVHVDNIIAAGSSPEELESFCDLLKAQWEITKLGNPSMPLASPSHATGTTNPFHYHNQQKLINL
jgi:hypothetical protein